MTMKTVSFYLFALLLAGATANPMRRVARATKHEYKMCVPESLMTDCNQMASEDTKSPTAIVCIPARDRYDCYKKIQQRKADFGAVDPEDMYVASNIPDQDFTVFQEIRSKIEPDAEFRYEGVAVIPKDLELPHGIRSLKGLKSCHTGVGRNVGYKIPLTKLRNMGIIGGLNETELSSRENELKQLSSLFSKACIVGKWSSDPEINRNLKIKYSNLCQMCEHPEICDYPDKFSGYDGALRCLAHNGGQVAWTKVIFVRKFFGLSVGVSPAVPTDEDASNFAYLCPDGTRVPVNSEKPCRWAARPWQGYMANADVVKTIDELRAKISKLNTLGEKEHAHWLQSVLILDEKTVAKNNKLIAPRDYLDKANYTDVIEREYGPPIRIVRFCVTSDTELAKCRDFSKVAFSRDLRPRFDCVQEANVNDCFKSIRDNAADVISVDPSKVGYAKEKFNLKPILVEDYAPTSSAYYAVAVVKKNTNFNQFADLKGAKSCHSEYGSVVGFHAPINTLIKAGLIEKNSCPYGKALAQFFSGGSCVPGAKFPEYNVPGEFADKLCSQCAGNVDSNDSQKSKSKCQPTINEAFYGDSGAFRCMAEGHGDVAFIKHTTVSENTDGKNKNSWAKDLKSSDFELLCPKGGKVPIGQFETCNMLKTPPHMIMTSNSKSNLDIAEIQHVLVSSGEMFNKRPDYFKLFGSYDGKPDLLFKDTTTGLSSFDAEAHAQQEYTKALKETTC